MLLVGSERENGRMPHILGGAGRCLVLDAGGSHRRTGRRGNWTCAQNASKLMNYISERARERADEAVSRRWRQQAGRRQAALSGIPVRTCCMCGILPANGRLVMR